MSCALFRVDNKNLLLFLFKAKNIRRVLAGKNVSFEFSD